MRNFNELSALWRAPFFSRAFYQDVALNWRGIGMRYLMLIVAIAWIPPLISISSHISNYIDNDLTTMMATFPTITLKAGHATSAVAQPYILKDDHDIAIFVFDTTGAIKRPSDANALVLMNDSEILQETGGGLEHHSLAGIPDGNYDGNTVLKMARSFHKVVIPVGLPVLWALWLAYRLVVALIFAVIGLLIAMAFDAKLPFAVLLRLSIVAMTAHFLITLVASTLQLGSPPLIWLVGHVITLCYLIYGIKVAADATRQLAAFPVEPPPFNAPPPDTGEAPSQFP